MTVRNSSDELEGRESAEDQKNSGKWRKKWLMNEEMGLISVLKGVGVVVEVRCVDIIWSEST